MVPVQDFLDMLHMTYQDGQGTHKWTVQKLANEICASRPRVTDVLNNKPGHGGHLRRKLAKLMRQKLPMWRGMLAALNWDEDGRLMIKDEPDHQKEFKFLKSVGRSYATTLNPHVASIGITINKEELCIKIHR
jgi:hypothetical protein